MKKLILVSLALLGSFAVNAQNATNEPAAMTFSVKFDWSTNQTVALKARWREEIAGVQSPPPFGTWATDKIKAEMATVAARWEAQRTYRARVALDALIARMVASEPNPTRVAAISNQVVAAEQTQAGQ